ncbi:MAG: MBL fold metallo-hydrolase [Solirubrobacteraceae bacterium]|nr:MBL fold metallo-hydrolase [Solirubrobacteraceae bacterium]
MGADQIADGLWQLQGGPGHCNVYFLRSGDGVVLFDAGAKTMRKAIAAAAQELGGLQRVVLGHAHTDHRGAAPGLGAPVHCHADAVDEAQGRGGWEYWDPKLSFLPLPLRVAHLALQRFAWDGGPVQIAGTVAEDEEIAAGFKVVLLPGHAPGQIALWRESDRVALTTDVFYVVDMWGRPSPPLPPTDGYSQDPALARASILRLADLEPAVCWPGHGAALRDDPVAGTVAAQLRAGVVA